MRPLIHQIGLWVETIAAADVPAAREGKATRADGSRYSVTSQAATDALNPEAEQSGILIAAADAARPLRVASLVSQVIRVQVGTGGCSAGDYLRPEYAAGVDDADAFVSEEEVALPTANGTYYHWGVALEDGAAGDTVYLRTEVVRVEVTA